LTKVAIDFIAAIQSFFGVNLNSKTAFDTQIKLFQSVKGEQNKKRVPVGNSSEAQV
jgi:hypothetical protein